MDFKNKIKRTYADLPKLRKELMPAFIRGFFDGVGTRDSAGASVSNVQTVIYSQ